VAAVGLAKRHWLVIRGKWLEIPPKAIEFSPGKAFTNKNWRADVQHGALSLDILRRLPRDRLYRGKVIASDGILWQNTLSPTGGNPDGHFNAPIGRCHDCGRGGRPHAL
jgi:hypothetical protein